MNYMTKSDFIELLKSHADNAGSSRGRFITYGQNENNWSYVRPTVDCFEPTINLTKEGSVEYWNYGSETPDVYTYEDFAKMYYLI